MTAATRTLVLYALLVSGQLVHTFRSSPLTAPKPATGQDASDSLGVFSKWAGSLDTKRRPFGLNSSSIESELAAIFRGVADGVTPSMSGTTTRKATTTPRATTTIRPTSISTTTTLVTYIEDFDKYDSFLPTDPIWPPVNDPKEDEEIVEPETSDHLDRFGEELSEKADVETDSNYEDRNNSPMLDYENYPIIETSPTENEEQPEIRKADVTTGVSVVPQWVQELGIAWVVHVHCTAGLYSLLAVLSLLWLMRIQFANYMIPKGYYITLHLLMFLASFLLCVHLFHDPYGSEQRLPRSLSAITVEIGWPCLTAALTVMLLAIVKASRCPRVLPQRPYMPLALALIAVIQFFTFIATHVLADVLDQHAAPLRTAARAVTVAWAGAVAVGGLWSLLNAKNLSPNPSQLLVRLSRSSSDTVSSGRHSRPCLVKCTRMVFAAAICQLILVGLHLYALTGPYDMMDVSPSDPWHWLAFQTVCRLLEITMWTLLGVLSSFAVAGSPVKRPRKSDSHILSVFSCRECGSCTSLTTQDNFDEVYPTMCQTNQKIHNLNASNKGGFQDTLPPLPNRPYNERMTGPRFTLNKSATLQSGNSDTHLLWNQGQSVVSTDSSSRPQSLMYSDNGCGKFRLLTSESQEYTDHDKDTNNLNIEADIMGKTSPFHQRNKNGAMYDNIQSPNKSDNNQNNP